MFIRIWHGFTLNYMAGGDTLELPIFYEQENIITAMNSPGIVHCDNTTLVNYFKRYLYQEAVSTIKVTAPETWNLDYLLYTLFARGYIAVVNTNNYGVICQSCGLSGYDIYYAPTHALISNPLLRGILQPRIHVQCEVLKLTPDYTGIDDMITYYANKLALAGENVDVNLINTKLAYIFTASNKAAASSFKMLYDDIVSGKPAVVVDKSLTRDDGSLGMEMFNQQLQQTYIAGDVLSDMRKIKAQFNTEIGIPNANTDKKERLITDEVNANNTETRAKLDLWIESLNDGAQRTEKMFGIELRFEKRFRSMEGGASDGKSEGNA